MQAKALAPCLLLLLSACAAGDQVLDEFEPVPASTVVQAPAPDGSRPHDPATTARGKYFVELLGCGACHTDGALIGEPRQDRLLAGSRIGLAHSNPLQVSNPGVVFPSNLTPDVETGIGSLSDRRLIAAIRTGVGRHGRRLHVMPVPAYLRITDEDVNAIVAYLRSVPAVRHAVPDPVPEGTRTAEQFVHFGVYRSRGR